MNCDRCTRRISYNILFAVFIFRPPRLAPGRDARLRLISGVLSPVRRLRPKFRSGYLHARPGVETPDGILGRIGWQPECTLDAIQQMYQRSRCRV